VEHFEDDDDNDNDSDDVEDVSVHGSWDNTSLSPAASNMIVACDFRLPPHPAVSRVILDAHSADRKTKEALCRASEQQSRARYSEGGPGPVTGQ
jgi:hypothetical protein